MSNSSGILLVAATGAEMRCFGFKEDLKPGFHFQAKGDAVSALITGVGIPATAFHLGRILNAYPFALALNAGLAGSFDEQIVPGDVVEVTEESFGDLGAEDHENYLDLFQLGLVGRDEFPFNTGRLFPLSGRLPSLGIRQVRGTTVNTVHGAEHSIRAFRNRNTANIETMEGAAFVYACNVMKVPSLQVRAISNRVEARNRSAWKVNQALEALAAFFNDKWPAITNLS